MNRRIGAIILGVFIALAVLPLGALAGAAGPGPRLQAADQAGTEELTEAKRYYLRGVELVNSLKYLDAVEQFQLAIDEDPDYVDAYQRLAHAYTEMAETESDYYMDALDVYEDLEAMLPPDDIDVRKNKAYVQAAMGDMDDAIVTYQQILEIAPEDCQIWGQIGRAQQVMAERAKAEAGEENEEYASRLDEAIGAFKKVTEYCPDDVGTYNQLGEIYFNAERMSEAAAIYEILIEKDPENVNLASRLCYLHYKAEDWAAAAPAYERLLELDPGRVNDRAIYAKVLQKLGRNEEAAAEYLAIINADPEKKALFCNLGFLYSEMKDWEKMVEIAMRGIGENAPQQGCMYVIWGQGLEYKGDAQLQEHEYDRAIGAYGDAKLKLTAALGDANFGDYARKRIARIDQLIERARQVKMKAEQGG